MSIRNIFRGLWTKNVRPAKRRPSFRLGINQLDDRLVPSTVYPINFIGPLQVGDTYATGPTTTTQTSTATPSATTTTAPTTTASTDPTANTDPSTTGSTSTEGVEAAGEPMDPTDPSTPDSTGTPVGDTDETSDPAPAAPQGQQAGAVQFSPMTINDLYQQTATVQTPENRDKLFAQFKKYFNVDLTDANVRQQNGKYYWITNVYQQGFLTYGNFVTDVQFSANLNGNAADIIQTVSMTKTDKTGTSTITSFIEGFAVDDTGKAKVMDSHILTSDLLQTLSSSQDPVTITVTMRVGVGVYNGQRVQGLFQKWNGGDPTKVDWKGPTRDYKITFTIQGDGTWSFKDESTGAARQGKLNTVQPLPGPGPGGA